SNKPPTGFDKASGSNNLSAPHEDTDGNHGANKKGVGFGILDVQKEVKPDTTIADKSDKGSNIKGEKSSDKAIVPDVPRSDNLGTKSNTRSSVKYQTLVAKTVASKPPKSPLNKNEGGSRLFRCSLHCIWHWSNSSTPTLGIILMRQSPPYITRPHSFSSLSPATHEATDDGEHDDRDLALVDNSDGNQNTDNDDLAGEVPSGDVHSNVGKIGNDLLSENFCNGIQIDLHLNLQSC
ncbi:hypothetical protein TorRG33x02_344250, partial [Trema orientale]